MTCTGDPFREKMALVTASIPVSAPARRFPLQGWEPSLLRRDWVAGSKNAPLPANPLWEPNELFPDCSSNQIEVYWQI